mgnify:CR=1 FL=1|tara:strand:- start:1900 stop:2079 length:180 start_codon:yes stop_codon:yes gene_type:complete
MIIETVKKIKHHEHDTVIGYMVTNSQNNENVFVPIDTANTDYQAIQEWVAEGNTIQEAD